MTDEPTSISAERRRIAAWLRQVQKQSELNDTELGKLMGVSRFAFNRAKLGKREVKQHEVTNLSRALQVAPPGHLTLAKEKPTVTLLYLHNSVAAGVWREENTMPVQKLQVYEVHQPEFDGLEKFLRMVEDDHANLYCPRGFYIVCVNYSDARETPLHNDKVVVEVMRPSGLGHNKAASERTIRQIVKKHGRWVLQSLSSSPSNFPDIPYAGDTDEIRICDLIISRTAVG